MKSVNIGLFKKIVWEKVYRYLSLNYSYVFCFGKPRSIQLVFVKYSKNNSSESYTF